MNSRLFEVKSDDNLILEGMPIVFEQPAVINGYTEVIAKGALDEVDLNGVYLFYNHDTQQLPLAKSPDTMELKITDEGLHLVAMIAETEQGRAVYEAVKRGDLKGMSFSFVVEKDRFEGQTRIIEKIEKILECSIAPYPAYKDTKIEARSEDIMNLNPITGQDLKKKEFGDDVTTTGEYRTAFYKNILGQELKEVEKTAFDVASSKIEQRADAFINSTNAAAVIPTETMNEIISKARTQGNLLSECRAFSVPSKIAIPVATPSTRAAWHVEGVSVEAESLTPENVVFDSFELMKLFSISAKAKTMSIAAFESYLTDELKNAMFETLDYTLINGTGTNEPKGLLHSVAWVEDTNTVRSESIGYSDVVATVALLKQGYSNGAKWAMNTACLYNNFYGLTDSNKRPVFITDPKTEGIGKILGFDVIIDDNMPNDTAILGNFDYIGYNLPESILIETSRDSSFRKGLIDIRALAVADIKVIVPEAFVKLIKGANG